MTFRLGCSTIVYRKMSLEEALTEIKGQGFDIVDIGMIPGFCPHFNPVVATEEDKAKLRALVEKMDLRVSTLNVCSGNLTERKQEIEFIKYSLALGKYLGAYAVTVQSGILVSPQDWWKVAKQIVKDFKELARYARDNGQDLAIEIHKEMLIETPKQATEFLDLVDKENVGVTFDPAHLIWSGIDPVEAVYQLKESIKHVHLKDARNKDIHYPVGDGVVNFRELLRALKKINYVRTLALEIEPLSDHLQDINHAVKKSRDYLVPLLEV